ncbi:MAG: hypothetical protein ACE5GA_00780 [Candidatus Zixiibacteriota bacterium]
MIGVRKYTLTAETDAQVSAFLFPGVMRRALRRITTAALWLPLLTQWAPAQSDSLTPYREGPIDQRDILVRIVSDTIHLNAPAPDTLLVTIDAGGTAISGFDFTFAYDISGFEIVDALPGSFLDSCNWEYFIVRRDPRCDGPCPGGLVKVIALAEFQKRDRPGVCNAPSPGASLIKLVARSSGEASALPSASLRFFWVDCGDNTISSVSGHELFLGKSVIESDSVSLPLAAEKEFPSYRGPISDCLRKRTVNPPQSKIIFANALLHLERETAAPDSSKSPGAR